MKPTTAPEPPASAEPTEAQGEEPSGEDLVELILAERAARLEAEAGPPRRIDGVVIGVLEGFTESGEPLIQHPESPDGARRIARSVVALTEPDVGREVALLFEGGDTERPMVMGLLHAPRMHIELAPPVEAAGHAGGDASAQPLDVTRDGERIEFNAEKEIVLRCGKASITLTRAGKILIRGAYLLTRSSGVNRIQGGSVQIN